MKLSFCTNGSMRVLKTWATSGPAGSALTSTSCAGVVRGRVDNLVGRQTRTVPARRAVPSARRRSWPTRRRSESDCPAATASTISRASSSSVGGVPSKYRASHVFVDLDDRFDQRLDSARPDRSARPSASAGGFSVLATPLKSCPEPIGTLSGMQALPNSS